MPDLIKPAEVTDILRIQLEGLDSRPVYEEKGVVLQVSDGVVRIYGLYNAGANELLEFDNGIRAVVMNCLLYTSPSPRDRTRSRMPSSA